MTPPNSAIAATSSRREFLKAGAATALVIGIALRVAPSCSAAAQPPAPFAPNAFLRITSDGRVTVICGPVEMGQGVLTAIPMLVAEELDANWAHVHVEQAPTDAAYNNPAFNMQGTGGSTSVRAFWTPMRKAGAAAREMLVAAAAAQWRVDVATLKTSEGQVIAADGRRLGYGALVAAAAQQPVPTDPKLKDRAQFKLLGQPLKRLDAYDKIHGKAQFGLDAHVPGMLVAVMSRAPLPGATLRRVADSKARAVKGVHDVIKLDHGVAVLADGYWAAKQGRDLLDLDWDLGAHSGLSSEGIRAELTAATGTAKAIAHESGNVDTAAAATTIEALYEAPYLAHACMEPMNCTAWVRGDDVELWVGTQSQGPVQGILANALKVPPAKIKINALLLGGGFGRRFAPDFTIDAALLSKLSGRPVKLIYSREDDMAAGYYRPPVTVQFAAGLTAQGGVASLKAGIAGPALTEATGFGKLPASGVDEEAVAGIHDHPYDIANQRVAYGRVDSVPQVWFWRSVAHSQNIFCMEGFIDEVAVAAKQDPYEFRRALMTKEPRARGVLELAAQKASWGKPLPTGVHRGIAYAHSFGSHVAEVAEVSVDASGTPRVHRVVAAVDCGMTVNPEIIRRQIEGAIVYGLSAALYGRITFKNGRVEQTNFADYAVLRMADMPKVEVYIVDSDAAPGGIGEPGTPPIAPAVVNAIYAATGKRLRRLPIDTSELKQA